jgi:hypothetical protein
VTFVRATKGAGQALDNQCIGRCEHHPTPGFPDPRFGPTCEMSTFWARVTCDALGTTGKADANQPTIKFAKTVGPFPCTKFQSAWLSTERY